MMTPFDIPASPSPGAAETAGRRGARHDAAGEDGAASGKERFADHWRMLAETAQDGGQAKGAAKGKGAAEGVGDDAGAGGGTEDKQAAKELKRSFAAALDGLRLPGGQTAGEGEETGDGAGHEAAPDPTALLRLALGADDAAATGQAHAATALTGGAPVSAVQALALVARTGAAGEGADGAASRRTPGGGVAPEADLHLATREPAAQEPLRARVLHQATHFAPIGDHLRQGGDQGRAPALALAAAAPQAQAQGQQAPAGAALGLVNLQNIASAVAEAAGDGGTSRAAAEAAARPEAPRAGGPLRTLTIQLTPISLGKVTVEMRLVDGAMRVDITVADARALEMVRAERDSILSLVRNAGVTPEAVTIQSADQSQAGGRQGGAAQGGGNMPGGFGEGAPGREDAPGGRDPQGRREAGGEQGRAADEASGGAGGGGRDIYL